ncbi:hypothetical protein LX36DRAFT_253212 [Colletotrichum falcatum]|nr:hypothetical protein LX36DRAFT_253212 [Colletotrichum falcatum]
MRGRGNPILGWKRPSLRSKADWGPERRLIAISTGRSKLLRAAPSALQQSDPAVTTTSQENEHRVCFSRLPDVLMWHMARVPSLPCAMILLSQRQACRRGGMDEKRIRKVAFNFSCGDRWMGGDMQTSRHKDSNQRCPCLHFDWRRSRLVKMSSWMEHGLWQISDWSSIPRVEAPHRITSPLASFSGSFGWLAQKAVWDMARVQIRRLRRFGYVSISDSGPTRTRLRNNGRVSHRNGGKAESNCSEHEKYSLITIKMRAYRFACMTDYGELQRANGGGIALIL